ncbi:MAG TPA: hypothetical protein VFE33_14970 [Thermoanaerobaculia bacterium]|nr:hypothetical protein [Thermoanaerobaculia bacterium]
MGIAFALAQSNGHRIFVFEEKHHSHAALSNMNGFDSFVHGGVGTPRDLALAYGYRQMPPGARARLQSRCPEDANRCASLVEQGFVIINQHDARLV